MLSRAEKLIAIAVSLVAALFFVFKVYAQTVDTAALAKDTKRRVESLEKSQPTMLYMTCGLFRKAYPDQVPAECDNAISKGRP